MRFCQTSLDTVTNSDCPAESRYGGAVDVQRAVDLYVQGCLTPTWAKLVRTLVDGFQCVADVVGQGVFGCERVASGVDLDGAVAA